MNQGWNPVNLRYILGALDQNLAKILTKGFAKKQDSCQEVQAFSYWVRTGERKRAT